MILSYSLSTSRMTTFSAKNTDPCPSASALGSHTSSWDWDRLINISSKKKNCNKLTCFLDFFCFRCKARIGNRNFHDRGNDRGNYTTPFHWMTMPQSCRRHHWMGKIPIKNETNKKQTILSPSKINGTSWNRTSG